MNIKGIHFVWKQKVYPNLVEAQKEQLCNFFKKLNMSLINKTAYFYIENRYVTLKLPSDMKHTRVISLTEF